MRLSPLMICVACRTGVGFSSKGGVNSGASDTGEFASLHDSADSGGIIDTGADDTGADDTGPEAPSPSWCFSFEEGTLREVGYADRQVELDSGAILRAAMEGEDFSALIGEEDLAFRGLHALLMRSSHQGDVQSVAVATTLPFEITDPHLWWWQLSEVGDHGVSLEARLLDAEGAPLATLDVPTDTGGYVPAREVQQDPIPGFPEIRPGEPTMGEMVLQTTDVSSFIGHTVQLELRQHTRIENNGFFTLIDDICAGQTDTDPGLAWSEAR